MTATAPPDLRHRPWWEWMNVLGLDAVLTALLWLALFGRACGANLIPSEYIVLGCAVWSVYALDRLLDGSSGLNGDRHRFAAQHAALLAGGLAAAAGISLWHLLFRIREIVLFAGINLLAAIGLYFAVTWFSRRKWPGLMGAGILSGLIAMALIQGTAPAMARHWVPLWRAALAGFLLLTLVPALRRPDAAAPWTLPRKLLGGQLFAIGTALAPHAHLEMWRDLLTGPPVILFGVVCGLNSLGIRLWENPGVEDRLLTRCYPWLLGVAAAGSASELTAGDPYTRPVLLACGLSALLLLAIHATRHQTSVPLRRALADAALIVSAALMLLVSP